VARSWAVHRNANAARLLAASRFRSCCRAVTVGRPLGSALPSGVLY